MKIRTGVDLVEISRLMDLQPNIRRRFMERVLTSDEIDDYGNILQRLAAGFAAKEAISKALGCGIGPISWHEMTIKHLSSGEPVVELSGKAAALASEMGITQWSISISHTKMVAIAMVVALSEP